MKKKTIILVTAVSGIIITSIVSLFFISENSPVEVEQAVPIIKQKEEKVSSVNAETRAVRHKRAAIKRKPVVNQQDELETEIEPEEAIETVESLKEKITDIAVEYTDDISLLDDLVQQSASEPEELWEGDWVSIDDWKRNNDSFTVERNEDGEFELIPEKDNTQSYSYNEETKEFEWVLDYYGKKVTHKAKFISEDVMVLMKISGIKVALDIYKRDAG